MDKLEHYLDRVCLSIGGPKSLRKHVRQELREHLLDAVAERKAAGLSEEEALTRALEDFGGSEQVRTELEATHGHRMLPVVIDKAMQWKEMTMRAKWLWTTWAYLAVVVIIALEFLYLLFTSIYILPKMQKLADDGFFDEANRQHPWVLEWLYQLVRGAFWVADHLLWIVLVIVAAWGLFEWRVRSENKTFMRLSALGTGGVGLMAVVLYFTGSMIILFVLVAPGQMFLTGDQVAVDQTTRINESVAAVDEALQAKEWEPLKKHVGRIMHSMETLVQLKERSRVLRWAENIGDDLNFSLEATKKLRQAAEDEDADRLEAAMQEFTESFEPIREQAERMARLRQNGD